MSQVPPTTEISNMNNFNYNYKYKQENNNKILHNNRDNSEYMGDGLR